MVVGGRQSRIKNQNAKPQRKNQKSSLSACIGLICVPELYFLALICDFSIQSLIFDIAAGGEIVSKFQQQF